MSDEIAKIPEYYSDSFRFSLSPYGVSFTFSLNIPHPSASKVEPGTDLFNLRMSLEQAKVMAMMLRRNLKSYEKQNDLEISLPAQLYTQLGIAREDWGDV